MPCGGTLSSHGPRPGSPRMWRGAVSFRRLRLLADGGSVGRHARSGKARVCCAPACKPGTARLRRGPHEVGADRRAPPFASAARRRVPTPKRRHRLTPTPARPDLKAPPPPHPHTDASQPQSTATALPPRRHVPTPKHRHRLTPHEVLNARNPPRRPALPVHKRLPDAHVPEAERPRRGFGSLHRYRRHSPPAALQAVDSPAGRAPSRAPRLNEGDVCGLHELEFCS
jgi:hypothetical protein